MKVYRFPAGIFEIDEQLLVPERTTIAGAADPNDMQRPTESPDWQRQTLFLATRGASNYSMNYCHAKDMVTTRVGFVLSSHCTVTNVRCPPSPRCDESLLPRPVPCLCPSRPPRAPRR